MCIRDRDGPVLQRYKLNIMFHSEGDKLTNLVQDIGAFLGNGTLGVRAEREGDWAVVKILYSFAYENTEGDTAYKYLLVTHKITLASYEEILLDMTAVNDVWSNASSQFQTDPSTELNFAMNRMYSGQEYRDGSLTWSEFMDLSLIHISMSAVRPAEAAVWPEEAMAQADTVRTEEEASEILSVEVQARSGSPVSYTHLDVYKRQEPATCREGLFRSSILS